jgi:hypothetical protein
VPEPKTVKNRVHLDVSLRSEADLQWLVSLGAQVLRRINPAAGPNGWVLTDPEGNEFCAFPPEL